jgi:hypothetical protein
MKKKNRKNHIRMRFSTLLLCCLAIVLCAAPCDGAFLSLSFTEEGVYCNGNPCDEVNCNEDGEYDVTKQLIDTVWGEGELLDMLEVGTGATVNLYTSVTYSVQAHPGSILNIHSGTVGLYVFTSPDEPKPIVTVYGTGFAVDWNLDGTADPLDPSETKFLPSPSGSVLKGTYKNGDSINLLFYSPVPIHLLQPPPSSSLEEITIDIKPDSNPNNINLKSKGVVPVAVLTTNDFDASDVDPDTVEFAGASPVRWTIEDVDDDGDEDMLFHFKTQNLELDENSKEATLTATLIGTTTRETTEGEVVIQGTDEVCIKPQKKKK